MTEPTPPSPPDSHSTPDTVTAAVALAVRFAHLVSRTASEPGAVTDIRRELRAFLRSMKGHTVVLTSFEDGVLLANGEPCSSSDPEKGAACVLLAERLAAYGVEMVTLLERSAEADVNDMVRLLATVPSQPDPAAFFAARASVIDVHGIPRVRRASVAEPTTPLGPPPSPEPEPEPQAEVAEPRADRLSEALEIPVPQDPVLTRLLEQLQSATELHDQGPLLRDLVAYADLAFRTGRHLAMLDAIAAFVAIEFVHLERDPSDARRAQFTQPLRRLAKPTMLRQLAVMRHQHAADALLTRRLQAVLHRFGADGAEALVDEYVTVPSVEARASLLQALRAMRRTMDVLHEWMRDPDDQVVREAITVLGDLRGEAAGRLLAGSLRHREPRVRRAVVTALAASHPEATLDLLVAALDDVSPLVRARGVSALRMRGAPALPWLLPLLNTETDTEVLYATMHAVGTIGASEGLQALIACAQGESANPIRRNSIFRLQACAALVLARTPQAMTAVEGLREDRDRVVSEGARRLVAQAVRRRTTGSMRIVTE